MLASTATVSGARRSANPALDAYSGSACWVSPALSPFSAPPLWFLGDLGSLDLLALPAPSKACPLQRLASVACPFAHCSVVRSLQPFADFVIGFSAAGLSGASRLQSLIAPVLGRSSPRSLPSTAARVLGNSGPRLLQSLAAPAPSCPALGAVATALDTLRLDCFGPWLLFSTSSCARRFRTRQFRRSSSLGRKSSVFVHLYASVVAAYCCCHRHCYY